MGFAAPVTVSRLPSLPGGLGPGIFLVCQAGFLFTVVAAKDSGSNSECLPGLGLARDLAAGDGFSDQCAALLFVANVAVVLVDAGLAALLFVVIGDFVRRSGLTWDSGSSGLFPYVVEERLHPTERTDYWIMGGIPWIKDS